MKKSNDAFTETRFDGSDCYLEASTTDNHAVIRNRRTNKILVVTQTDDYMIFEMGIPEMRMIYYKFVNLPIFVVLGVEDPKPPKDMINPIYSIRQSSKKYIGIRANTSYCNDKLEIDDYYSLLNDIQEYFMNDDSEMTSDNNQNDDNFDNTCDECCNCCGHCDCNNSSSQYKTVREYLGNICIQD